MKKISTILVLLTCVVVSGCNKSHQINGSSMKSVNRSMASIKERLPLDQRIEYEVSFWTLRDELKDNKAFLDAVDGKTPEQMIETGRQLFNKRKAAGQPEYEQFDSWEQMIAQYSQERIDQNRKRSLDDRDKKYPHRVDYKMHAM
ncbi:MAG: hypothetical protein KGZ80_06175 [Methylomonas sp.]|nr:hypothetical protein [Methylomonas sp.]PPD20652.1 MAG: hypothetical protein CTY23_08160 [Methylomonas sp.]PPD25520.1 MAG: hypothetical protein CTY22_08350 [Methylomonas sp.]PPD36314.1 MAG: hypothetical protein CTY21_08355 [Methylomonas sp.]PPD40238.1 MAG: hypothetical protein CTY17_06855 [Methylomonas sp.]